MKSVNRKIKIWDFSSRLVLKKKMIEVLHRNDPPRYSSEMESFGIWTKDYLSELGPTFIKLGQTLSTRKDIFPIEFLDKLVSLQDEVIEIPSDQLIQVLNEELSEPVNVFFRYFEMTPHKCASIGQVHRGILRSGKKVAVKVQRPGVKEIVTDDINSVLEILAFFELIGYSTGPSAKEIFNDAKERLYDELDYTIEANNAVIFRNNFKNVEDVIIPRVFISKSTDKLLIMEWVSSVKITDLDSIQRYNINQVELSKLFLRVFIIQTMEHGFFHADPHPGNIGVSKDGKMVIYDYGLVVKLPSEIKMRSKEIIMGILQRDTRGLVDLFISLGIIIPRSNKYEITLFFESIINYIEKVDDVNNPELRSEIISKLSQEKPFNIPSSFIFLAKTFGLIEGICTNLDPDFSFFEYLQPYFQNTVMESIDLQKMATNTFEIPSKINNMSTSITNIERQKAEIDIKLNKYENIIRTNNFLLISLIILAILKKI